MEETGLKRTLGLGACVFFGVGSILGAGIYALLGKVAGVSGHMIWLSFLLASVTALLSAFSYAELSAAFPRAGGEYKYAREAFGKGPGTILGFMISLNGTISGAAVSLGFAGYFVTLIDFPVMPVALGIIALVFLVNILGIRQSSTVNIIFTIIEVFGLALAVYAAVPEIDQIQLFKTEATGWENIYMGAALSFFAYIGFEEIVKLAEETRKPEKNIPRALFISCFIVFVIYSIVAISAVNAISPEKLGESESPLALVVEQSMGSTGVLIISIIALFSTTNTILSNMLGSSRVVYNMGEESQRLSWFGKVWKKRQTPARALLAIFCVMAIFSIIGDLKIVALIANFFILTTFLVINASVIKLRHSQPETKRPFKIPLSIKSYPVFPFLAILMTLAMIWFTIMGIKEGVAG